MPPRLGRRRMFKRKFFMSDAMLSAIRRRAVIDGMSSSAVVREAVTQYLDLPPEREEPDK